MQYEVRKSGDVMNKRIQKLNNGIMLISHRLDNVHSVTVSVNFKVGSLFETAENNGITHLLEHLLFRRLDDLTQMQLYYRMQCLGAEIIGKTFNGFLSFEISVVPENFIPAFEIMLRYFNSFSFSEDEFDSEKKVVLKQIENDYQSFSQWIDENYLRETQYELPIMGTEESVENLTIDSVEAWKEKYLCPQNSCIAITGNFTTSDYKYACEKLSLINSTGNTYEIPKVLPVGFADRNYNNRYSIFDSDSELCDIVLFVDIGPDTDYETVRLLSSILGEGCGSRLGLELREKYALTDDIATELKSFYGFNIFAISYTVNNSDFYKSVKILFETIKSVKQKISKSDYDSSICFFTKDQLMDYDYPREMNRNYVLCDFVLGLTISEPSQRRKKYESIKIEDLEICAKNIFKSSNISFLIDTSLQPESVKQFIESEIKKYF